MVLLYSEKKTSPTDTCGTEIQPNYRQTAEWLSLKCCIQCFAPQPENTKRLQEIEELYHYAAIVTYICTTKAKNDDTTRCEGV